MVSLYSKFSSNWKTLSILPVWWYSESLSWGLNASKVSVMVTLCGKFSSNGLTFENFHLWGDIQKACRDDGISQKSELWSIYVVNLVGMGWLLRIFACVVILKACRKDEISPKSTPQLFWVVNLVGKLTFENFYLWSNIGKACHEDYICQESASQSVYVINLVVKLNLLWEFFLWGHVGPACREDEISEKSTLQFFSVVNLEVSWVLRIYTCEVMLSQLVEAASTHLDETHTKFLKVNSMVTLYSKLSTELFFENFSSKPLVYTLVTRTWISCVTHVYVSYRIYAWLSWCCHHHTLWWHTYEWVVSSMW